MLRSISLATNSTRCLASASSTQTLVGPAVRLLLHDYQIDPKGLEASGPKGNLLKSDVLAHISRSQLKPKPSKIQPKAENVLKLEAVRPVLGSQKRHVRQKYEDLPLKKENLKNITEAHYSLTSELVVDNLLREIEKADHGDEPLHSIACKEKAFNDFVRKASAVACERVPEAHMRIEPLISVSRHSVHHGKNEGRLHSHEFQVSNLGTFDSVEHFMPVGQPSSETYTLAVGRTKKRVILAEDGIRHVTTVKVTLSCDHRAVDNSIGAQWFKHFKRYMEDPHSIFI